MVEWHWYYSLPSLPLWGLLVLLLVAPRHNRDRRAWLILVLPLLVAGFGQLMSLASGSISIMFYFLTIVSIAWAVVWLLAPWLSAKRRLVRALLALVVMALVGAAGYVGYFEFTLSGELIGTWAIFWGMATVSLVAGMTISGHLCREKKPMYVFMLWLALWIPVTCLISMIVFTVIMATCTGDIDMLGMVLCSGIVLTFFFSLCIYILNVPLMILVRYNSLYRERFAGMFCPIELPDDYDPVLVQFDMPFSAEPVFSGDEGEGDSPFADREPHSE